MTPSSPISLLLTNDDGVDAPGLASLYKSVRQTLGDGATITVVAPDRGRSECGHSVTTGRPLRVDEVRPGWFAVDGTPVDCVRVALGAICPDAKLTLSGVNAGANLGIDLMVSGTFAAAKESAIEGVHAMAVSHYRRPDVPNTWDHVPDWVGETLQEFIGRTGVAGTTEVAARPLLWNVNLPAVDPSLSGTPPRTRCRVDVNAMRRTAARSSEMVEFSSDFHGRPRDVGTDVDRCFSGAITISELASFATLACDHE